MSISVDDAYSRVAANKDKWATLPLQTKLDYLLEMKQIHETLIDDWAKLGAQVRGYGPDDYIGLSVAYGFGPYTTAGALSALTQTYTELVQDGKPREPNGVRTVGNQQVIDFYPYFTTDKIMHAGCKGELYLEPNKPIERAVNLTHKTSPICAILGAGNFEAPVDILTKLFVDNAVAVFKPNPVNELAQKTMLPKLFASIIRDGFLEIVIGGVEVGGQLLNHPLCDEALMTGGASTYDKIVWGPNTEEAKKSGKKLFSKKFEAELGAVSPWMIVPGEWTESELNHQVSLLVANKLMNSGAVCASPQVFIVDKDWPQRERFTELLKEKFRSMPNYIHYYPGTAQRCNQAKGCAHKFEEFVKDNTHEKAVNPIVFFDHPADSELHKNEAFAPVLCELACPTGNNVEAFLKHTLEYVNSDRLFGSLSCSVVIDPRTQKKHSAAFEDFIDKLEYGCIAVNEWGGFLNVIPGAPWGAFPKHTPENIQSGMGKVSNWLLYSNIQKAVFRSPFVSPGHMKAADKNTPLVIKRGAYLSSQPGVMRLLGVLSAKFLGW